jgi:EmrB/QacA subfamily drug resistance transporter
MTAVTVGHSRHRWQTLAVVGTAFFMTVLDVSIVNVALPSIGRSLRVGDRGLQWVLIAYALTFGGFLLLGGRAADLLGRRRVFAVGLALFTLASLTCGLAGSLGVLVASRAVQGLGAAIISPAALSIVTTAFEEGAERNKALGIWGALGGSGAAVGVLAGGVITKWLGWSWIFFVNVPVGAVVSVLTFLIVRESRVETAQRHFDPLGALTATGSLLAVVYAISKAPDVGWSSARTIALLVAGAALLALFLAIESRVAQPLMPLRIFRIRTVAGANAVGFLLGAVIFADFFVLTLYVQQVLGWSALKTGVTFLATAGTTVLFAGLAQALVTRLGARAVMTTGLLLLAGALAFYTRISVHGSYAADLLPGYLVFAGGLAFSFIPVSIAALAGVEAHDAGLASGLINTNQQVGGAVGVAVASTIVSSRFASLVHSGHSQAAALTDGFQAAFWLLTAIALVAAAVALAFVRVRRSQEAPSVETAEAGA